MIRIKTENENGRVFTVYLPSTQKWHSVFTKFYSVNSLERYPKKSLHATSLFEAGLNHLELCKGLL